MKNSGKILLAILLVVACAIVVAGCSKQAGPSDDDILKAIKSTVESSPKGYILKSAITVLERGKQLPTGDWPIKAEYTASSKDGKEKKEVITYNLTSSINDMGATVWMATEAK